MRKLTITPILLLIVNILFGQIDDNIMKASWKPGKEKVIYGNTIFRVEGKNDIGGATNIGYETLDQVKGGLIKRANTEMWTEEKKTETLASYDNFAPGGLIHLYITRLTIDAANTKMFTVIVKDTNEKEIFRKELDGDIPETPSGGNYWWNYTTIPIDKKIEGSFFIYVIDQLGSDNGKFKFEVKR